MEPERVVFWGWMSPSCHNYLLLPDCDLPIPFTLARLSSLYFPHRDIIKYKIFLPSHTHTRAHLVSLLVNGFFTLLRCALIAPLYNSAAATTTGAVIILIVEGLSGYNEKALERKCAPSGVAKLHACYYSATQRAYVSPPPGSRQEVDELMVSAVVTQRLAWFYLLLG